MPSYFSRLFRRPSQRQALAELLALDDHLLRDIGISRSDLHLLRRARRPRSRVHE
jgi:uncharacterized protein YjiS (DUF1127 family)